MKISIYALHLGFGGVEKYVTTVANMLADAHSVEIVSTYRITPEPAFPVDPRVKITYLMGDLKPNKEEFKAALRHKSIPGIFREGIRAAQVLLKRKKVNIQSIKKCDSDVIISTRIFHNALIGKYAAPHTVKITGEHNHHNGNEKYINEVIASCRSFNYFIPISKELCDFYREPMKENGVKTEYIRFCIDKNQELSPPEFDNFDVISVGRLSPEKGPLDLVRVFELITKKMPAARLHIVGDGEEYSNVQALIKEKGLSDKVVLHGFRNKKYIYELLEKCSLYLMTSHTESFGLVLLEAMCCGVPCIAFDSAQGAHEIIENGKNGYLIENRSFDKMAETACRLLSDKDELCRLSRGALNTADDFSYEKTKAAWLDLMNKIEEEKGCAK